MNTDFLERVNRGELPKEYRFVGHMIGKSNSNESVLKRIFNVTLFLVIIGMALFIPTLFIRAIVVLLKAVGLSMQDGKWERLGEYPLEMAFFITILVVVLIKSRKISFFR